MEEEALREFNFKRQRDNIKIGMSTGDAMFVNGKLVMALEAFVEADLSAKKLDARLPSEIRWKKAVITELKRKIETVDSLLPKEKQKDAMELLRERMMKEGPSEPSP